MHAVQDRRTLLDSGTTPTRSARTRREPPPSVADHIVDRLSTWGVTQYFGYPGDGISGMTSALQRRPDTRFVQVRHEETAGFAAAAHVKYGGGRSARRS